MSKANRPQTDDNLNKLLDYFAFLNQNEHISNVGIEEEDTSQNTRQQPKHANNDQPVEVKQSNNSQKKTNKNSRGFTMTRSEWIIRKPETLLFLGHSDINKKGIIM